MIIENPNTNGNSDKHSLLAHAQTVSNFFIDAIEKNDCNVKITIGFYQELDDTIKSIQDIDDAFKVDLHKFKEEEKERGVVSSDRETKQQLTSNPGTEAAIKALKDKCFNCNLKLPRIKFDNDLKFLFNRLQIQIEVFENVFKSKFDPNFCHLIVGLKNTCIPDLLKILGMMLTAFASILALRKLPSFSLNAFIKGVIGGLLARVVGSLKISLDMTSTGLPCLISTLEELAYKFVGSNENLYERYDENQRRLAGVPDNYEPVSLYKKNLDLRLKEQEITSEEYTQLLEEYRKNNDPGSFYIEQLENKIGEAEESVSEIFSFVNDVIAEAQEDINAYIESILGVMEFFECETTRTGPNFTEVLEYIDNLMKVINIFSALIATFVKYTLNLDFRICTDEVTIKDLNKKFNEVKQLPMSNKIIEEVLEEFSGTKAKLDEEGLAVLIYDKPVKQTLPKLTLFGCNFKEFTESHKIDEVIKRVVDKVVEEEKESSKGYTEDGDDFNILIRDRTTVEIPAIRLYKPIKPPYIKYGNNPGTNPRKEFFDTYSGPGGRNGDIGSNIVPKLDDKVFDKIKDIVKDKIPNITPNIVINEDIFVINRRSPLNIPFRKYKLYKRKIRDYERRVIDKIEIDKGILDKNYKGLSDAVDELTDFIYNNPVNKPTFNIDGVEDFDNTIDRDSIQPKTSVTNKYSSDSHSSIRKPETVECRSIEDVMTILQNIKV